MPGEERLPTISEIFARQVIFFSRAEVQNQWAIILISLMASWLLSKWSWRWLQKQFPEFTTFEWDDGKLSLRQYLAALLQKLDFPVFGLVLLGLSQLLFQSQDWTRGLLKVALQLMGIYLAYRFFLATLYSVFPLQSIRKYHSRLLAPLFTIFVYLTIISLYNNLDELAQASPFKLFNSPITMRAIFLLIAGLYFWFVVVFLLEDVCLAIFRSQTPIELGKMQATLLLIRYFLISLGIVLVLGYVGVNGTAIAAIAGGLSVGIGFGLQQVVSNFMSGILLLFEGVLRPGDIISIEGNTCEVKRLGIRATTVVKLVDNSEQIIPNQTFFISDVTTYTGSDRLINCSIKLGVGYSSDAKQVIDLLLTIASQHPQIIKIPCPVAFFLDFGDSSLNFELKFWLDDINTRKRVISDLNCLILDVFAQNDIEIPFPQQDIHIRS